MLHAAEEEGLLFLNRSTYLEAKLVHLDEGLGLRLRIGEELVGIESLVPQKVVGRAVKVVAAAARRYGYGRAAVAALLGSGVVGRHLILLHVVGGKAIDVVNGGRHRRLVSVNAVNREVEGAVPRAVYADQVRAGAARALDHTRLKQDQSQRITSI